MTCAMVLYFDSPFEDVDAIIGLTKSAEVRMKSTGSPEETQVLVIRGMGNVSEAARARLAEFNYRLVDASGALEAVRLKYEFARDTRIWRNEPFHELCFLRWLVLDEYFGDTPLLAMDADIVWRVDPAVLMNKWKVGGSTLCFASPCFAYIKGRGWYESYASGLARVGEHSGFGGDFKKDHFKGLYHDQALIQYLIATNQLENDTKNFLGHGLTDNYRFTSNPLGIKPSPGEPPLTFERRGNLDIIGGKIMPYWHMQQRFVRYLWCAEFIAEFVRRKVRIPYEGYRADDPNLAVLMLNSLHLMIARGQIVLNHPLLADMRSLAGRDGIYSEFFDGDQAARIFREEVWWAPGVWEETNVEPMAS